MQQNKIFLVVLILFCFGGMALVVYTTSQRGIGLSADPVNYISTAKSLIEGKGYVRYDGQPYVLWPPLLPTILAGIGYFGVDLFVAARYLNIVTFGLIVFFSGLLFRKYLKSLFLAIIATAAVVFSVPMMESYTMATSDLLFSLLSLLCLLLFVKFQEFPRVATLMLLSTITALGCLQRYIGVTLVLTFGLLILLGINSLNHKKRVVYLLSFGFISLLPLAVWMIRNLNVSHTLTGPRIQSLFTFQQCLTDAFDVLSVWFLPHPIAYSIRLTIFLIAIVIVSGIFWKALNKSSSSLKNSLIAFFVFDVIYLIFLLYLVANNITDAVSSRFLIPIFVPFLFFFFISIEKFLEYIKPINKSVWLSRIGFAFCLFWLLYPLSRTIHRAKKIFDSYEIGIYHTARWDNSETLKRLKLNPLDGKIYSNQPEVIYARLGSSVNLIPLIVEPKDKLFGRAEDATEGYLVWFEKIDYFGAYNIKELSEIVEFKEIAKLADGTIYRYEKRLPDDIK